jgi:hypothetical protein
MRITPVTGSAFFRGYHNRLLIRFVERQDRRGTELDAQPAAFTPHPKDNHLAARTTPCFLGSSGRYLSGENSIWHNLPVHSGEIGQK